MFGRPMDEYWNDHPRPSLFSFNTGMTRGYYATWQISENKLYLIEFYGENRLEGVSYSLDDLFPANSGKVFAIWFSGDLQIPIGKQIDYSHSFIGVINETSTKIVIENGIVIDSGIFTIE